jgi:hypothetical protein
MAKSKDELIVPEEVLMSKIYYIRGYKVMFDEDLAELFELTNDEFENLRSQIGTSSWGGSRYMPMAFTESSDFLRDYGKCY